MRNWKLLLSRVGAGLLVLGAAASSPGQNGPPLTLEAARAQARKQHPRITAAELHALAARQTGREVRSAYYPTVTFEATAVGNSGANTRIAAGGLNNPLIYEREADGVKVSQLITDFGRTAHLSAAARARARAAEENQLATRAEITLAVDTAYFSTLRAQAVVAVARQTVAVRQAMLDQVTELTRQQLRSALDLSFAQVRFHEGRLLLAGAENEWAAARAALAALLGERAAGEYALVEVPVPAVAHPDAGALVAEALRNRPDLAGLRFTGVAAAQTARAEKEMRNPTLTAVGAAGIVPVHAPELKGDYAAAGLNFSIPLFEGMRLDARAKGAQLEAAAAAANTREAEDQVVRDVRVAVLNLDYAGERLELAGQLQATAREAFTLARAKYQAGSSSIVELNQAQLAATEADLELARAKYELLTRQSILQFETGREP